MKIRKKAEKLQKELNNQEYTKRLLNGDVNRKEYIPYLQVLHSIFSVLESNELLTDNLNRVDKIEQDMRELSVQVEKSKISEVYIKYLNILPSNKKLPHIYFNYLELISNKDKLKDSVSGSGRVFKFENESKYMNKFKKMETPEWEDEVNRAYIFWVDIYKNLQKERS